MKTAIHLFILSLTLSLLVSCSLDKGMEGPIRIGINAWPGYEFLYLAQEKGFFEAEGVDVRIVELNSLADGRRAYERGQLDGLACTLIEHLQILDHSDRSPQITLVADYSNGADVIMAKPSIEGIQSLKGARIGLEIDSLGVFMLARVLEKARLTLEDVSLVPLDQISMEDNFSDGSLDAVITYPPISIRLKRDFSAHTIFSSAEIPDEIVDLLILEESLIEERPEAVEAISRAFFAAQRWAYENPNEAFPIMGRREGLSGEEFGKALEDGIHVVKALDQHRFFMPDGPLENALANCETILRQTKQISNPSRSATSIHRGSIVIDATASLNP